MKFRLLILFLLFLDTAQAQDVVRILFVGNSLTYYNNLPVLVEKAAAKQGLKVETAMLAKPNYAIIDHLEDGELQKLIKFGNFNYLIVQQGPSSQPEGRKMLIDDVKKLAELCLAYDTRLCLLMVWPSLNYYSTFDGVIESYTQAAEAHEAMLIPVGKVWYEYITETSNYDYYGPDGFHPSLAGSKVAARIIVTELFK